MEQDNPKWLMPHHVIVNCATSDLIPGTIRIGTRSKQKQPRSNMTWYRIWDEGEEPLRVRFWDSLVLFHFSHSTTVWMISTSGLSHSSDLSHCHWIISLCPKYFYINFSWPPVPQVIPLSIATGSDSAGIVRTCISRVQRTSKLNPPVRSAAFALRCTPDYGLLTAWAGKQSSSEGIFNLWSTSVCNKL